MEDFHVTAIEFLEGHSLYAVLDGHGKKGHIHARFTLSVCVLYSTEHVLTVVRRSHARTSRASARANNPKSMHAAGGCRYHRLFFVDREIVVLT